MKKRVFAILLSISMIAAIVGCGKVSGTLDEQAATRVYDPNDDTIYIVDPFVPLSDSADSAELRALAQAAMVKVNEKRVAAGLGDLKWTIGLEQAAQVRANEIENKFSHDRPDGSAYWTVNGNLVYGENLARGFDTADDVVAAWVASPTHNANLMDPGYLSCSIAIHEAGATKCWAQEFGY